MNDDIRKLPLKDRIAVLESILIDVVHCLDDINPGCRIYENVSKILEYKLKGKS